MAASETINGEQNEVESIVNRWLLDYYYCCVLERFVKDQYEEFCSVRSVVESVLARPLQITNIMPTKIRVMQFLSRIHEGEKLDMSFESDESVTPLESALSILEVMGRENVVSQQDFQKVSTSLKEMMVGILIKNDEFDKAKKVLNKHFPKTMIGKKAVYMGLIQQKKKTHEVIEKLDFQKFKEEILVFCKKLCPCRASFLQKAAKQLIDEKKANNNDGKAVCAIEEDEPSLSPHHQFSQCKNPVIQMSRLKAAFKALSVPGERTFAQVEKEVEKEERKRRESVSPQPSLSPKRSTNKDLEQSQQFQRDSGSPMEASPADQPPQTDTVPQAQASSLSKTPEVTRNRRSPYNLARLVVEPDSQVPLRNMTASQEQLDELGPEEPGQSRTGSNKKNRKRVLSSSESSGEEQEHIEEEEEQVEEECTTPRQLHKKSTRKSNSRRISSDLESDIQESSPHETPSKRLTRDKGDACEVRLIDLSLRDSPNHLSFCRIRRTSSTPTKEDGGPSHSKWKELLHNAKESRETWSDEETYFTFKKSNRSQNESTSGPKKRMWTDAETLQLIEGVKKFGEGNWTRIKDYFSFKDRTNVQLKDRWRTMKKMKLV
ncbi:telomeric repeat binding factor a isoform X2 [Xyrichtys novacula]|uniref:Telomeric repeat binding factor a isoform X2 n=1 Tax=Xyrichtys novacula TaxID=13765 RepID=A0AAV1EJR1_XYRNO|nr:telomeric repeat binding factor a isoform X2 [Xyrichtys novacula]